MQFDRFCALGGDVSRETFHMLASYSELLTKWNARINLVAPSTLPDIWTRHILDSLQLLTLAPPGSVRWLDLGSGGGLPGLVIAMCRRDDPAAFTLIESDRRKSAFLRTAIRELRLNAIVIAKRIEHVPAVKADVVSARALAPLSRLLEFQERHGALGCCGLYPKGATAEAEIADALEHWRFSCEKAHSATSAGSFVLKIGDLERA